MQQNNDLIIDDFEFKVGDLGLAKSLSDPNDWLQTICGTPVCMAPEVI